MVQKLIGHVLDCLKQVPDSSVHAIFTSPPYWGVRSYGSNFSLWPGEKECKNHQWKEIEPKDHKIRSSSSERMLQGRGNIIDSGGSRKYRIVNEDPKYLEAIKQRVCTLCGAWEGQLGLEYDPNMYIYHILQVTRELYRVLRDDGTFWLNIDDTYISKSSNGYMPKKNLLGIPFKLAFLMQEEGWYWRHNIIWHKPNAKPETIYDRPWSSHEYILMFSKSEKYFYNRYGAFHENSKITFWNNGNVLRSVWSVPISNLKDEHVAPFPDLLAETIIRISTSPFVCKECKKPYEPDISPRLSKKDILNLPIDMKYKKACNCSTDERDKSVVLDPFSGSGTVSITAERLGRNSIYMDISPEYERIFDKRFQTCQYTLKVGAGYGSTD